MRPEDLAARHPRLYHQTAVGAWPQIEAHGLLSARALMERAGLSAADIAALTRTPRPEGVVFEDTAIGRVEINDNRPLSIATLERCLDDGLTPQDWCEMLADRVFFWTSERGLARLLGARTNRHRPRDVLVIDTLSLARAHADRMALSPINSGSTIRKAARRGIRTFAPLPQFSDYAEWSRLRGRTDRAQEVVVRDGVPDIAAHVVERRRYADGAWQVIG